MDNVEDRQSRIEEEKRAGGAGTAYAVAVTHMLKSADPDRSTRDTGTASNTDRKTVRYASTTNTDRAPALNRGLDLNAVTNEGDDGRDQGAGDATDSDRSCDDDGSVSGSVSGSEVDDSEGREGGEGGTRRGWAERRARLTKDGMHGRRLPPPEAEEERASAKADKREVRPFFLFFVVLRKGSLGHWVTHYWPFRPGSNGTQE